MAISTTYLNQKGDKQFGFNIGGKTYKDQAGTQRIDEGSYTRTGDTWWQMGKDGGVQVNQENVPGYATKKKETKDSSPQAFNSQYSDDINNVIAAFNSYQGADSMGRDEATARANSQLNGMYDANLDKTLNNYNKDAVSRGMFGQLPIEALKQGVIADNELDKSVAINGLAGDIYSNDFNMARQKDSDFYSSQNNLLNALNQGYGLEQDAYNMQQDKKQEDINMLGQYSNDFQQRINDITNDSDKSNDWEAPYLNMLRQDKITGINSANAENQSAEYDSAMKLFNSLGYASGWIADALGVPEGTTTASYANMQADNARISSSGGDGGNMPQEVIESFPDITFAQKISLWNEAIQKAQGGKPATTDMFGNVIDYQPTENEVYQEYLKLAKIFSGNPFEMQKEEEFLNDLLNDMSTRATSESEYEKKLTAKEERLSQ